MAGWEKIIITILACLVPLVYWRIDRFIAGRGMATPLMREIQRMFYAQLRVLVALLCLVLVEWMVLGRASLVQVGLAYAFTLLFSIIMEIVWQFVAPVRNVRTLPEIVESSQSGSPPPPDWLLIALPLLPYICLVGLVIAFASLPGQASLLSALLSFDLIVLFFLTITPEYLLLSGLLADYTISEEDRSTLLFQAVRDPLPVLVFLGILANMLRASAAGDTKGLAEQVGWYALLVVIFLVALYLLLQYQKGSQNARKLQRQVLSGCIETLDHIAGLLTFATEDDWQHQVTGYLRMVAEPDLPVLPLPFSPKSITRGDPRVTFRHLIGYLEEEAAYVDRSEYLEYTRGMRKLCAEELEALRTSRPAYLELVLTFLSLTISAFLTALAEKFFASLH
jgi:hypothetical protein